MEKNYKFVKSEDGQNCLMNIRLPKDDLIKMAEQTYGYELTDEEMIKCCEFVASHEEECLHISDAVKEVFYMALWAVIDPARCDWQKVDPEDRDLTKQALMEAKKRFEEPGYYTPTDAI